MDDCLPSTRDVPHRLHEAMRYSALAPGKRIRPALCMASAEAVGAPPEVALDAACAVEFVHCFSLIHDDLPAIDDDDLRRGIPTCHKAFGEAMAILAGDALFALAFEVVAEIDAPNDQVKRVTQCLARATGSNGLVGGEVMDIEGEGAEPTQESLAEIHGRKTGALITASCVMGGILAGASEAHCGSLEAFGRQVGLAFQIADDVLNVTGEATRIGKAVGSDRERGKQTYAAAFGVETSDAKAEDHLQRAVSHLDGLPGDVHPLAELARFAVRRDA